MRIHVWEKERNRAEQWMRIKLKEKAVKKGRKRKRLNEREKRKQSLRLRSQRWKQIHSLRIKNWGAQRSKINKKKIERETERKGRKETRIENERKKERKTNKGNKNKENKESVTVEEVEIETTYAKRVYTEFTLERHWASLTVKPVHVWVIWGESGRGR